MRISKIISIIMAVILFLFSMFSFLPVSYADDAPPLQIVSTIPADKDSGVSASASVVVTFNDNIQAGSAYDSISVKNGDDSVAIDKSITDDKLTITPHSGAWDSGCGGTYIVTIPAGSISNTASTPNILGGDYTFSFSTADTAGPAVLSTSPSDKESGVSPSVPVVVTFSENIQAGSAYDSISVKDGDDTVAVDTSITNDMLTIAPHSGTWDGGNGGTYTVNIPTNSISDTASTPISLKDDYTFSFSTADTSSPTVLSTSPADKDTGVSTSASITVTFSEIIKAGSAYDFITVKKGEDFVAIRKSITGNTLTITPSSGLWDDGGGDTYTVTIQSHSISDTALMPNYLQEDYTFSFNTAGTGSLKVISTSPAKNETGVSPSAPIVITFNENIQAGSAYYDYITVKYGSDIIASDKSITDNKLTIAPHSGAWGDGRGSKYTVTVPANSIADLSSPPDHLAMECKFSFTTADSVAPEVITSSPANGENGIEPLSNIVIRFSENIQAAGQYDSITLKNSKDEGISIINKSILDFSLTLTLQSPLTEEKYTVSIPAGSIKDMSDNALVSPYSFSFSVLTPPQVISTSPADGARSVSVDKAFCVNFDQPIEISNRSKITVTPSDEHFFTYKATVINDSVLSISPTTWDGYWDHRVGITYTVTIKAGAVEGVSHNPNTEDFTYSFTTFDGRSPDVLHYNPSYGGSLSSLDEPLTITYSTDIYPGLNVNDIEVSNWQTNAAIPVTVTTSGNEARILPVSGRWPSDTSIRWEIPRGAFQNYDGVLTLGTLSEYFRSVDTIHPYLVESHPANGSIVADPGLPISLKFNESIYQGPNYPNISASYSGHSVSITKKMDTQPYLIITNSEQWEWGKTYTINIPAGAIQDYYGNTNAQISLTLTTIQKPVTISIVGNPTSITLIKGTSHKFYYTVDVNSNVTLQILSYDGSTVYRSYTVKNVKPGTNYITWNGKPKKGSMGYNTCFVKITADPVDTTTASSSTVSAQLNLVAKASLKVTKFPSKWYPSQKSFYTEFTVNTKGTMSITFYKGNVAVLYTSSPIHSLSEGSKTKWYFAWNGYFEDDTRIAAGKYKIVFTLTNGVSTSTVSKNVTVKY